MFESKCVSISGRIFTLTIFVSLLLSVAAFARPSHGGGRGKEKKLDKFINGHDARDGRFDGRGPKRDRVNYRRDDDRDRWDRKRARWMDRDDRWDRRRARWMDRDDRWDRRRERRMDRDDRRDRRSLRRVNR